MTNAALNAVSEELPVKTGLLHENRRALAQELGCALASTYVLYHKTHGYHWNVAGPLFYSVHNLTDSQYRNLAEAIDDMAERIRAIGFATPVGLSQYLKESVVDDVEGVKPAGQMIAELADDHQRVAMQLREAVAKAEALEDVYTADLLTARIGAHEEAAWMLNALIVEGTEEA